jgi:hypothetical protein
MRRIWILDIALFALLVAIAVRFHNEWIMFKATHQSGAVEPEREKFAKLSSGVPANAPAPANWTDIPSHNPFSFDRTDIAILEPKAPPPPPPPKVALGPKPVLFGTMILGKDALAMVGPGKPGNRQYKPMKVGEVIDGWTITSIADKAIAIKGNDTVDTVTLNDPTAQIPREHERTIELTATPAVVSVGAPSSAAPAQTQGQRPAQQQPTRKRRVTQVTPFGVREIEVDEP